MSTTGPPDPAAMPKINTSGPVSAAAASQTVAGSPRAAAGALVDCTILVHTAVFVGRQTYFLQ